jgi:hypothetical protein
VFKGISTVLEQELSELEDKMKSHIQEVDDLDNQKEWVDWITKYGDDIQQDFKKPTTELLNGLIDRISVSPVMGETRDGKETQRSYL